MTRRPTISVLMSVHNGQDFLREAIDSILAQTYHDFEFIVVDDASTDQSLKILRSYSDERLCIFPLEKNVGLVDALNLALNHAQGEFVARMDADDISHPDRFTLQLQRFEENQKLVLLGCAYTYIDSDGKKNVVAHPPPIGGSLQTVLIESGNPFCHPTVMMRTRDVKSIGGYRKIVNKFAQDYDLFLRLAEKGEVDNLQLPLLRYRIHPGQITVRKMKSQLFSAQVYRLLARQRRSGEQEDPAKAIAMANMKRQELQRALVNGYFYWSGLMGRMGYKDEARYLRWSAIKVAPLSSEVRSMLFRQFDIFLRKISKLIGVSR